MGRRGYRVPQEGVKLYFCTHTSFLSILSTGSSTPQPSPHSSLPCWLIPARELFLNCLACSHLQGGGFASLSLGSSGSCGHPHLQPSILAAAAAHHTILGEVAEESAGPARQLLSACLLAPAQSSCSLIFCGPESGSPLQAGVNDATCLPGCVCV